MNRAILTGHVGKDPEERIFDNGDKVVTFSLATNESYKNKEGEMVDKTEWHNIKAFRGLAGVISEYVKKGSKILIEGKIVTESWGEEEKKYKTVIYANNFEFLGAKIDSGHHEE
jgi:single-strand DNA-binding protein